MNTPANDPASQSSGRTVADALPPVVNRPPLVYLLALGLAAMLDWVAPLAAVSVPYWTSAIVGGGVLILAVTIIRICFVRFKSAETPVPTWQPVTALVTNGIYGYSRNPIYIALTLFYAGLAITFQILWAAILLIPVLIVMDRVVIAREERLLTDQFGETYQAYRRRVRRWI